MESFWNNTYKTVNNAHLVNQIQTTETGFTNELLIKASPEECFLGIGNSVPAENGICLEGKARTNESYPYSMAIAGNNLWFATFTNMVCGFFQQRNMYIPFLNSPQYRGVKICDNNRDNYETPIGTSKENWRPVHIYKYEINNNKLIEMTPNDDIVYHTFSLRSAVAYDGIVFFLGQPLKSKEHGSIMYAYNNDTGEYLGHFELKGYNNSRNWLVTPHGLYVIVNRYDSTYSDVLKWIGNKKNVFSFEIVGTIDGYLASMVYYQGRILADTWQASYTNKAKGMEIFMSPELKGDGLTEADADKWKKVWGIEDYEPDPATAASYAGGAMAVYGDYVYFGSMNIPLTGTAMHILKNGFNPFDIVPSVIGAWRAAALFRGKDFGTPKQKVEVLYGTEEMPVYERGRWVFKKNKIGKPLYGQAGFGNPFNGYMWNMAVYDNKLFVGTCDFSYEALTGVDPIVVDLLSLVFRNMPNIYEINTKYLPFKNSFDYGADLYYFKDTNSPAIAVTRRGFGNYSNFGVRTMQADDTGLYLGIVNPMNLINEPDAKGGFEIRRITALP
jgi:hypothetical protein